MGWAVLQRRTLRPRTLSRVTQSQINPLYGHDAHMRARGDSACIKACRMDPDAM
jgi:hypothetical protein